MPKRSVVLAFTSDQHCGGTTALCPNSIDLDDGGTYHPSKAQRWLSQCWGQFWERVRVTRDQHSADLHTVFHGDFTEGDHHHTTQILSGNATAQAAVVDACMKIPLALKPDRMFFVRGTEAHVGKSGCLEERIAKGLKKDGWPVVMDPATRTASWWHLRMLVHDTLIDVTHHGRTGQREHTRGSAAVLHAHDILLAHVKNKDRYPDLCVRGHYHKFNDSHDAAPVRVITTGAWQLETAHVKKVAADSVADIGGLIVVVTPDGYTAEKVQFTAKRGPVWRAR